MVRIGKFDEVENPEKGTVSKRTNETDTPFTLDKQKLKYPSDNMDKYRIKNKDLLPNYDGKEKLNSTDSNRQVLEKKKLKNIETSLNDYFKDLKKRSDYPDTIKTKPFEVNNLKKLSPKELSTKRDEFNDKKGTLKKQWEDKHGQPWPKYDRDVYSSNGRIIRKAGGDYDAHHIHPLSMGGKNEVSNITPLHAKEHYDRQGIHSPNSSYGKLSEMLGGNS